MFNVTGKNVVIVGGLTGVGLTLTKSLCMKRVNKLVVVDTNEKQSTIQDLKNKCQFTKIYFERLDNINCKAVEIENIIQRILSKVEYIDCWINGMEIMIEHDLEHTMYLNSQIYMTTMMLVRDFMDRTKGGRGGVIVNLLSNLGVQAYNNHEINVGYYAQQYLINKQMLLSLSKTFSQEFFYQQTGVKVMCVMPVINQSFVTRNYEWIKKIGLQNLVVDMKYAGEQHPFEYSKYGLTGSAYPYHKYDSDKPEYYGNYGKYLKYRGTGFYDYDSDNSECDYFYNYNCGEGYKNFKDYDDQCEYYGRYSQGQYSGNIYKYLEVLGHNLIHVIETGKNGTTYVVGFDGTKNIQEHGYLSRL